MAFMLLPLPPPPAVAKKTRNNKKQQETTRNNKKHVNAHRSKCHQTPHTHSKKENHSARTSCSGPNDTPHKRTPVRTTNTYHTGVVRIGAYIGDMGTVPAMFKIRG
jgi:hypothetical protein